MAIVAILLCGLAAFGYWVWPKLKASTQSDLRFLVVRIAVVITLALLLFAILIAKGRYCVYKHGAEFCRVHTGNDLLIFLVGEPLILVGGMFVALWRWVRRIAKRQGVPT